MGKRMVVISAGVLANLVLAVALFVVALLADRESGLIGLTPGASA